MRLRRMFEVVARPVDLSFAQWVQLYALAIEFRPDLIVELGRGYGNSTCVLTEAANRIGGDSKVVSVSYDTPDIWSTVTALRLKKFLLPEWFQRTHILHQDIIDTDFRATLSEGRRVLLFWDAHGLELAYFTLTAILPELEGREHLVVVHDIVDTRHSKRSPAYVSQSGRSVTWLGDLASEFEELTPLYDFLSRNHISFDSPGNSVTKGFQDPPKRAEIQSLIEPHLSWKNLEESSFIYFDTNTRPTADPLVYPQVPPGGSLATGEPAPGMVGMVMDFAAALWNQRHAIEHANDRLRMLYDAVNREVDLSFNQWIQLFAFVLEFSPDLVVELGRGAGNSTCVFTETANRIENCKVVSIGNDAERIWATQTAPRISSLVPAQWFDRLEAIEQDIFQVDFRKVLGEGRRVLLFWDAHGRELAEYLLSRVLPLLESKDHIVAVHDITDARYNHIPRNYKGPLLICRGPLASPFEELVPLYDFLSQNSILFDTPEHSVDENLRASAKRAEIRRLLDHMSDPSPLQSSHWVYFAIKNKVIDRPTIYPSAKSFEVGRRTGIGEIIGCDRI